MMGFELFLADFLSYLREKEGFNISEDSLSFSLSSLHLSSSDLSSEEEVMNILRFTLCKNSEQYNSFPSIFHSFFSQKAEIEEEKKKKEKKVNSLKKKIEKLEEEEKERKEKKGEKEEYFETAQGRKTFLKKTEKKRKEIEKLINEKGKKKEKELKELLNSLFFASPCERFSPSLALQLLKKIKEFLQTSALKVALSGDKNLMDILLKAKGMVEEEEKKIGKEKEGEKGKEAEIREAQEKLDKLLKEMSEEKQIKKADTVKHRDEFIGGYRSVKSSGEGEVFLNKDLSKLSSNDIDELHYYIAKNARKFKTKISKNIKSNKHLKFDMKNIVKKACATDGVPLRLIFKKPIENKPRIVLFLDVSGSCSSASKMMLLFMYHLKQVFSGGCEAYAFVNSLNNITPLLDTKEPTQAISEVLASIPTRGVYSDYHAPLKYFYEHNMSSINKDTIVLFIGDARNNSNPTGEEYFKAISRKSRACFWLNTEEEEKWDHGDSIMYVYSKYTQNALPVLTAGDLINFVTNFKIRRGEING